MNKTKIDWQNPREGWKLTHTWNPITGCLNGCSYCYAAKMARRFSKICGGDFKPRFHADRLGDVAKLKKPSTIFVGSMSDMWGEWVPKEWIEKVLKACRESRKHRYLFLTKNPKRYTEFEIPKNCWLGVTCESAGRLNGKLDSICNLREKGYKTFLSAEPLLGYYGYVSLESWFDWVIVGAMTGPGAIKPEQEWIKSIKHGNIFYKPSITGGKK